MKKTLLFFCMSCCLYAAAQKSDFAFMTLSREMLPESTDYANYRTYDIYCMFTYQNDKMPSGRYIAPIYELEQDTKQPDYKIIIEITKLESNAYIGAKDTGIIILNGTAAQTVYDKVGNKIFTGDQEYFDGKFIRENVKQKTQLDALFTTAVRDVITRSIPRIMRPFQYKFVAGIDNGGSIVMAKLFSFKNNKLVQQINDSVKVADQNSRNPKTFRAALHQQLGFWQGYANVKGLDNEALFQSTASLNLAITYLVLGNKDSTNFYATKVLASDALNSYLKKQFKKTFDNWKDEPVLPPSTMFKHPSSLTSTFSMEQALTNYLYYELSGKILFADGSIKTGTCLISRTSTNGKQQGGIVSLDKADYLVNITTSQGNINAKLSAIKTIESGDTLLYCIKKDGTSLAGPGGYSILKTEVKNDRLNIFKRVFPSNGAICFFQKKGETEFQKSPVFGTQKWLKKYFADCPDLVEKIENKTLQDELSIGKYYANSCK